MAVNIRRAELNDLDGIVRLFDLYRQFYKKPEETQEAQVFLKDRLVKNESVIFIAEQNDGELVGFVQLYPCFSSLQMARTWILNDLYVAENHRRKKIGLKLIEAAHAHARLTKAAYISLETGVHNKNAQALYASLGYEAEKDYIVLSLSLKN